MKLSNKLVKNVGLFIAALSLMVAACSVSLAGTAVPATESPTVKVAGPTSLQIFFTDPTATNARNYEGGPDQALAASIDKARLSIDLAAYSFNLWSIRDALVNAHQRGVVVRAVMESDNMDTPEVQDLLDAGIQIIGDQHETLMHDKYVVIDRMEVWTGSMNFTAGGTYRDNNNLIEIHSTEVADTYSRDFEAMFNGKRFGHDAIPPTPNATLQAKLTPASHPPFSVGDTTVEVYFPPAEGAANRILELVRSAQESIYFMTYAFTSNDIGNAVIEQAQAGITVAGIMDRSQVNAGQGSEYDPFMQSGLDVRLDGNSHGLMHHKVVIIDQKIVITGSYNLTASAETGNDENMLVLFSPEAAAKYLEEFQKVYGEAAVP